MKQFAKNQIAATLFLSIFSHSVMSMQRPQDVHQQTQSSVQVPRPLFAMTSDVDAAPEAMLSAEQQAKIWEQIQAQRQVAERQAAQIRAQHQALLQAQRAGTGAGAGWAQRTHQEKNLNEPVEKKGEEPYRERAWKYFREEVIKQAHKNKKDLSEDEIIAATEKKLHEHDKKLKEYNDQLDVEAYIARQRQIGSEKEYADALKERQKYRWELTAAAPTKCIFQTNPRKYTVYITIRDGQLVTVPKTAIRDGKLCVPQILQVPAVPKNNEWGTVTITTADGTIQQRGFQLPDTTRLDSGFESEVELWHIPQ